MSPERPLTERQVAVLLVLLAEEEARGYSRPLTANEIGGQLNLPMVRRRGNGAAGRGGWAGYMGPAQRVIRSIISLRNRGLIGYAQRPDGLTGGADRLTEAGRAKARELRAEGTDG